MDKDQLIHCNCLTALKEEEAKYRQRYETKKNILDGLKADAFKLAINKIEDKAYGLVVDKLWKYYKKLED